MGAILMGRDPDLGRDLAVKVLLESHEDKPELVRRFVEEAQIVGQLQHPGIVPVYELGADGLGPGQGPQGREPRRRVAGQAGARSGRGRDGEERFGGGRVAGRHRAGHTRVHGLRAGSGDVERVDRRSDVFDLGAILCEILTGERVYTGGDTIEVIRKAMVGDTADALARLEGSGADGELVALARDCLAFEPSDRPRDAGAVSQRITAYLAGAQQRVQAAERAVAVAKAVEERRRRKVQVALAASVLALTTLGGLSAAYVLQQRQARAAAGQRIIDQVATLHHQALGQPEEIPRSEVGLAAVEQADPAGDPNTRAQLLALRSAIQTGLNAPGPAQGGGSPERHP